MAPLSVLFFTIVTICLVTNVTHASHFFPSILPPAGNSLGMKTKTSNGSVQYGCVNSKWEMFSMSAEFQLFDADSAHAVGNFSFLKYPNESAYTGCWTILNSEGDKAESGSEYSVVTGNQIAMTKPKTTQDLPDFLAIATKHINDGTLSLVSYISMMNTQGGASQQDGARCEAHAIIELPFSAEFHFWKQDLVPPSMPNTLVVESQRAIQGFYGSGVVVYTYDGQIWNEKEAYAKMYDVPGGREIGSYFTTSVPDKNGSIDCWQVNNPNGFTLMGKLACKPEIVSPSSLPWTLNMITTIIGNLSIFGPYTYIQMISTRGGLPPTNFSGKLHGRQTWRSSFSAIFWFYSKM